MKTMLLDTVAWDLVLDVNGNIAVAENPYSLAQDAASACRTFLAECWYNTTIGVDYFRLLGAAPNIPLLKAKLIGQCLLVPDVVKAQVFITGFVNRRVTGQVQVTSEDGVTTAAAF
jgi:hypothetical protein